MYARKHVCMHKCLYELYECTRYTFKFPKRVEVYKCACMHARIQNMPIRVNNIVLVNLDHFFTAKVSEIS